MLGVGCFPSVQGFNARIFRGILSLNPPKDLGRTKMGKTAGKTSLSAPNLWVFPLSGSGVQCANFSGNSPPEPHSQSGAKDARTPNAAARSGRPAPARSVWSACVFSAALPPTFSQVRFRGSIANSSGNSLPEPTQRFGTDKDGENGGKNIFVRPKSLGFSSFRFRGSRRESGFGEFSP